LAYTLPGSPRRVQLGERFELSAARVLRVTRAASRTTRRRSAIRTLIRSDIKRAHCDGRQRHKTDSVFRRYDIVSPDDLRVAVERLDASAARDLNQGLGG
jgi:hypothetical protein